MTGIWGHKPLPVIPEPVEPKRIENYFGTTGVGGTYTVVYAEPYPTKPAVLPALLTTGNGYTLKVSSSSTTGFTITVQSSAVVSVLGVNVLGSSFTNVSGIPLNVTVVANE